ncbi:DUF5060 domain-containing protein [Chitinophaga ginsengisoli]|uniref:Uncharacterized protein DUF5060 n=1 Tax=Chitinophaga ginsengisoli TaxID=363837 RepID=A0A2P8FUS6_9BACT|nr:DUF5060 domain-containing protein [Chitinophaga ginsengisoli]PSL25458.1 uncharacterized protein DUF5060 [Chitinophaga ginsengisoli]
MPITFNGVNPTQATVAKWDLYEVIIDLTASYTNQYDYTDIAVQAILTSPTNVQRTVDAFWMQDYNLNTNTGDMIAGDSAFRFRFTPDEEGQWTYVLSGSLQGGAATTSTTYSFTCSGVSATGKGYIRKTSTNYLRWDSCAQYIPVGENIAFPNGDVIVDYNRQLNKLEQTGVNFLRIWMATWGVALEWSNVEGGVNGFDKLKRYKQTAAKQIDYLLNRGQTNGYAIMLCINYHNQFVAGDEWQNNPYNVAQGGTCNAPLDFFSDTTAKEVFKNRLRYLVARWGYAGSLQSWELFNEVDNTPYYKSKPSDTIQFDNSAIIDQWHNEMAAYLKSIDPNHLVTTSFGDEKYGDGSWDSTSIDFTQVHKYKNDPRMPRLLANLNQQRLSTYSKPVLDGEFGMIVTATEEKDVDPDGVSMHNVMWATLLSGSMGSAIPWWEHWVDELDLYPHFSRLAAFKDLVPFVSGNYQKAFPTYSNTNPADLTIIPEGMWPVDPSNPPPPVVDFTVDNEGELTPGLSELPQFVWGATNNSTLRRPPTFHVNYLQAGTFSVVVADVSQWGGNVNIYVDGVLLLDQVAQKGFTYTVPVSVGQHSIKVDNLGTDWILVSQFRFINAVGPYNLYALKSADSTQAAGYIQYRLYNHRYFIDNNTTTPPPPVPAGAIVNIPGMNNGTYTVNFYSCAPADTTAPAQPVDSRIATATNGVLSFDLPAISWDIAFTVGLSAPDTLSTAVSVTPTLGWAATTASVFTVSNSGIAPGASSLGMFVYGSQANTQYRNPSTFVVNYAQTGYFEVRTAATISAGFPRLTIYVDGVKMLDQDAVINASYVVVITPGAHRITVDNLGGDWTQVDHYSFVPSLAAGLPAPVQTASARTVVPGYPWGSKASVTAFTLAENGTLTPDASNLAMYVYGAPAHPEYYNPASINVNLSQDGYFKLTVASVSQNGARVSIYADAMLVTDQVAIANLSYVVALKAGTHNITVDNLGGDWYLSDALVFDVL